MRRQARGGRVVRSHHTAYVRSSLRKVRPRVQRYNIFITQVQFQVGELL